MERWEVGGTSLLVGRQEDQPGSEFTREVRLSRYVKYPSFNLGVRALTLARDLE